MEQLLRRTKSRKRYVACKEFEQCLIKLQTLHTPMTCFATGFNVGFKEAVKYLERREKREGSAFRKN